MKVVGFALRGCATCGHLESSIDIHCPKEKEMKEKIAFMIDSCEFWEESERNIERRIENRGW